LAEDLNVKKQNKIVLAFQKLVGNKAQKKPPQSIKVRFRDQVSIYLKRVFCCGLKGIYN
jgi:hypothetical protein